MRTQINQTACLRTATTVVTSTCNHRQIHPGLRLKDSKQLKQVQTAVRDMIATLAQEQPQMATRPSIGFFVPILVYTPWSHRIAVFPPYCSFQLHVSRRPLLESSGVTTQRSYLMHSAWL